MAVVGATRTIAGQCENMLLNLSNYFSVNGETHRDRLALIGRSATDDGMISSGFFRSSFNQQFQVGQEVFREEDGKIKRVILKYLPRAVVADVLTDKTNLCTAGSEEPYFEYEVIGTDLKTARATFTLSPDNWTQVCENFGDTLGRRWMNKINAINQKVDLECAKDIIAGPGANGAFTGSETTIPNPALIAEYKNVTLLDGDSIPIWAATDTLDTDMSINEVSGVPSAVLFGLDNPFKTFVRAREVGCCNDKGVDIQRVIESLGGFAPFKGRQIKQAFVDTALAVGDAQNAAVVLHPGAAHIIETFDYDHEPYNISDVSYGTTWIDPVSGEKYDVKVKFDDCDGIQGTYIVNIWKTYKAVTMPTDQYKVGDTKENQNGVYLYNFG